MSATVDNSRYAYLHTASLSVAGEIRQTASGAELIDGSWGLFRDQIRDELAPTAQKQSAVNSGPCSHGAAGGGSHNRAEMLASRHHAHSRQLKPPSNEGDDGLAKFSAHVAYRSNTTAWFHVKKQRNGNMTTTKKGT